MAAAAPWDGVADEDRFFVLVTGANSGIGLGIGQRLLDEFLAQRPSTAHLVLVTTTRSPSKSRATTEALWQHLRKRHGKRRHGSAQSPAAEGRIHLASVELDLCRLPSVYAAADRLIGGSSGQEAAEQLSVFTFGATATDELPRPTRTAGLARLDVAIFNAGIGGWSHLLWGPLLVQFATSGIFQATTYPTCKGGVAGLLVDPLTGKEVKATAAATAAESGDDSNDDDDVMGQVFCANVFGHYVLAHQLMPLLRHRRRPASDPVARVVWESSVEAVCWSYFSTHDFQGRRTTAAYESSKRLTDVLSLTAGLPGVAPFARPFFEAAEQTGEEDTKAVGKLANHSTATATATTTTTTTAPPPTCYLSHPGVVCSTLFPLPWLLFSLYKFAMYLSRWCGSPWHTVTSYEGAHAPVWLALRSEPVSAQPVESVATGSSSSSSSNRNSSSTTTANTNANANANIARIKWGSGTTRTGAVFVKETEVDGWGWTGQLHGGTVSDDYDHSIDNPPSLLLRRSVGRRRGSRSVTTEQLQAFEELGRSCWREMERLRVVWDGRVRSYMAEKDEMTEKTEKTASADEQA